MAGDWLKVEKVTPEKPEIEAVADILGIDPDAVFGKCFRVWRWFDDHTTGEAVHTSAKAIDRKVGLEGFADAMASVGWLVASDEGITLPNFARHNPETAKRRQQTAARVAKHRARNADVTPVEHAGERTSIPRPIARAVKDRDEMTCVYCGRKDGEYGVGETARDATISLDHVIPVTRGGDSTSGNLVCACSSCNNHKNDRTPEEAGLPWPTDSDGKRYGSVTDALPREEKRRVSKEANASLDGAKPEKPAKPPRKKFVPPTLADVQAYIAEKGYRFDAETFMAHHQARDWFLSGGRKMACWKSACTTFEKNHDRFGGSRGSPPPGKSRVDAELARLDEMMGHTQPEQPLALEHYGD